MPASTPGTPPAGGRGAVEDEEPLTPLSPSSEGNIDKVGSQQPRDMALCTGHMCGAVVKCVDPDGEAARVLCPNSARVEQGPGSAAAMMIADLCRKSTWPDASVCAFGACRKVLAAILRYCGWCFTLEAICLVDVQIKEVLASSDEDEGTTTLAASVKRWWTGGKTLERQAPVSAYGRLHCQLGGIDRPYSSCGLYD